ncbi:MAG: trypsin-like peptidase domain-containing protein, partial [Thermomicrobium sp.]|nr:trypsin-like peptidase domain-containing protein [Thermomicrobium sp.]MDW8005183.1 trypsin-like peptidase domain-containing protein [Thermomicrobium sp.]
MQHSGTTQRQAARVWLPLLIVIGFLVAGIVGGLAGASLVRERGTTPTAVASSATASATRGQPVAETEARTVAGQVYQAVGKAVVDVIARESNGFFDEQGSGSGVVVDQRGLIVTAAHVVAGASTVQVQFATGERQTARVLGV